MKKLAIIFPGMGYHVDKPLLYYSIDLLSLKGYECLTMSYPAIYQGERRLDIKSYIKLAYVQVEVQLENIDFQGFDEVLFVSKSMGSVIACEYEKNYLSDKSISLKHIIYTPIQDMLSYNVRNSLIYHGTMDGWCDTEELERYCIERGNTLYLVHDGNHSLEVEDTIINIKNLVSIIEELEHSIDIQLQNDKIQNDKIQNDKIQNDKIQNDNNKSITTNL